MDKVLKKQATAIKGCTNTIMLPHGPVETINDMVGADMIVEARKAIYESSEVRNNWEAWAQALESGDYKQDSVGGVLKRRKGPHYSHFCCLGVACDLQGVSWQVDETNGIYRYNPELGGGSRDCLPDHYLMNQAFGVIKETTSDEGNDVYLVVKFRDGGKYRTGLISASGANDNDVPFVTIAKAIRNTYLNPVYERMGRHHMINQPNGY